MKRLIENIYGKSKNSKLIEDFLKNKTNRGCLKSLIEFMAIYYATTKNMENRSVEKDIVKDFEEFYYQKGAIREHLGLPQF